LVAAPVEQVELGSFLDRIYVMSLGKWSRLYVKTGNGVGDVVLTVQKVKARNATCGKYAVVFPDLAVKIVDTKERTKVAGRRLAGLQFTEMPALTRAQKKEAEEAARDLLLGSQESGLPSLRSLGKYLKWLVHAVVGLWTGRAFGTMAVMAFFLWRVAMYFQLGEWLRWSIEMVETFAHQVQDVHELSQVVKEAYAQGELDTALTVFSFFLMGLMLLAWMPEGKKRAKRQVLEEPDSGSERSDVSASGEAGHAATSESESEVAELKVMMSAMKKEIGSLRKSAQQVRTDSDSSSAAGSANSASMVQDLMEKILQHEEVQKVDRQGAKLEAEERSKVDRGLFSTPPRGTSAMATVGSPNTTVSHEMSGSSAGSTSWVDLTKIRESMRDPKEKLIENLEKLTGTVSWRLPAGSSQRVAPSFLVKVFKNHGSVTSFTHKLIADKQIDKHPVAKELRTLSMVIDRFVVEQPTFLETQGCEMLARRLYAIKRAFREVHHLGDWKAPKGAGAGKWRSKIRWDLAEEIDWQTLEAEDEDVPEVELELQARVKDKFLMAKALGSAPDKGDSD
jgi:hypothetical protein